MRSQIGKVLPNGWTIVDFASTNEAKSRGVILAAKSRSAHPYAVWFANAVDDTWDTYHGDYVTSLREAVDEFDRRVND